MEFPWASKRRSWDGMCLTSWGGCSWPHVSWCGVPLAGVPFLGSIVFIPDFRMSPPWWWCLGRCQSERPYPTGCLSEPLSHMHSCCSLFWMSISWTVGHGTLFFCQERSSCRIPVWEMLHTLCPALSLLWRSWCPLVPSWLWEVGQTKKLAEHCWVQWVPYTYLPMEQYLHIMGFGNAGTCSSRWPLWKQQSPSVDEQECAWSPALHCHSARGFTPILAFSTSEQPSQIWGNWSLDELGHLSKATQLGVTGPEPESRSTPNPGGHSASSLESFEFSQ